jgi:AraC family transcriptional regulator of adaptative response/methylated-DNA-[protein]-cysteine methyltransferase
MMTTVSSLFAVPQPDLSSESTHPQDYDRIAQAIAFLRQHHRQQPDLGAIAQQVHLSEAHFQRLFTRWAGISPKRFLQYLTVEYAKSRMLDAATVLDVTWETGLSSPGRLHDLFVSLEAMSPGEFKANGAGLSIRYGIHATPFGDAWIAITPRGICQLEFLAMNPESDPEAILRHHWSQAEIHADQDATADVGDRLFQPAALQAGKPIPLFVKGTNFQIQVWRALLHVPLGHLATYQTIADFIGRPTSARAVGNAIGSNPVAYLIPCHRVIRATGEFGHYHWGEERKAALLGWEASRVDPSGENA